MDIAFSLNKLRLICIVAISYVRLLLQINSRLTLEDICFPYINYVSTNKGFERKNNADIDKRKYQIKYQINKSKKDRNLETNIQIHLTYQVHF